MTGFQRWVEERFNIPLDGYAALHRWSIDYPESFWLAIWEYCGVQGTHSDEVLRHADQFPGAKWFPGARLNFAENLLRYRDDRPALIGLLETGKRRTLSYGELFASVSKLANALRRHGIAPGDRVAGFMPNVIETVVAMLATTSIGAIWSSCSPDFGIQGVCDRFGQIEPRILFVADGYYYNGRAVDCLARVAAIQQHLPGLERVIVTPIVGRNAELGSIENAVWLDDFTDGEAEDSLIFEQLAFDHPLYIMYSSGTTGVPKCIVHGAGGTLLQHVKEHRLHANVGRQDVLFYYTTCGWMMWNWLVSGLASGCTVVLYDGSPLARRGALLMEAIDDEGISIFGTSAKFIASLDKSGVKPAETSELKSLHTILSTGSPLSQESYAYIYRDFKADVSLASISGGTDIISCFVLGNPNLPVYAGEIQCKGLGMAVDIWDDEGRPLPAGKGELVCTQPFPSTPLGFWNDPDGGRFHDAYFARFLGVWAHGDYGEFTAQGGIIIHGRSDAVLNPGGIRIGTAEIYRQVEKVDAVIDSVVVSQEWQGDVRVILFVVLRDGLALNDDLTTLLRTTIRSNTTARHVPAKILQVPDIPHTISGKIAELAVRNAIHGLPVKNTDALANPESLAHFRDRPELTT